MKPLQVALLVIASAVAGGLFMKWQISRNMARAAPTTTPVKQSAPPAPVQPVAAVAQPAPPVEPLVVPERKAPKVNARPHEVLKSHRTAPVMMARNEQPAAEMPPAAVAQPEPAVAPPVMTSEPVQQPEPTVQQPETVVPAPEQIQPAAPPQVTLKAGTVISARTGQGLSSDRNAPGDGFSATLDQPLVADGWVIAERGAQLEGKVVEAAHGTGQSHLVVVLTQLRTSDGQRVPIETETYSKQAQASSGESAAKVVAGTAIGAAIGAIAGGGRGAGIGAAAGTAAGAGGAMATRGKPSVLPAETLIQFRLKHAVTITERQARS